MLLAFRQASEQQSKYSSRACCLQGWLDITYLDPKGEFRLSRGNKGTLFVLTRDEPAKAQLLAALTSKSSNAEVIYSGRADTAQIHCAELSVWVVPSV